MAKISDRKMLGWVISPESTSLAQGRESPSLDSIEASNEEPFQVVQSSRKPLILPKERLLSLFVVSFLGLAGTLFFLDQHSHPQTQSVNSIQSFALISELSRPSQAPMPQVHVLDQTFVKILRIPGATKVASLKVQPSSTLLPQNPVLK